MKWLFVTLLVLNTAYFAWEFNRQLSDSRSHGADVQSHSSSVEQLRLLSELEKPPQARAPAERFGRKPPATNGQGLETPALASTDGREITSPRLAYDAEEEVCFSLGPISAEQDAVEAKNWLRGLNVSAEQRVEERTIATRYWIVLDTEGSTTVAREKLAELERKGVEDFLLTRDQDGPDVISLGLYSTRASLEVRLADLKKKGFEPQVRPRHRVQSLYWIEVSGGVDRAVLTRTRQRYSGRLPLVPKACEQ